MQWCFSTGNVLQSCKSRVQRQNATRTLLVTRASLLGARTPLVAPGITTRNKKLLTSDGVMEQSLEIEGTSASPTANVPSNVSNT